MLLSTNSYSVYFVILHTLIHCGQHFMLHVEQNDVRQKTKVHHQFAEFGRDHSSTHLFLSLNSFTAVSHSASLILESFWVGSFCYIPQLF